MSEAFAGLSRGALRALADALEAGRLTPPFRDANLRHYVPSDLAAAAAADLEAAGLPPARLAWVLRLLASERRRTQALADRLQLVWSGPEAPGAATRDTGVVLQQLFRDADEELLITTYAMDDRAKAEALFGALAARMDAEPALRVSLFVNIPRPWKDETPTRVLVRGFAKRFVDQVWPGERLPELFYDPRSLAVGGETRACLHAKCVVADRARCLVTSANLTEAAQERNFEAGVLVEDAQMASALAKQLEGLVERGELVRVALR